MTLVGPETFVAPTPSDLISASGPFSEGVLADVEAAFGLNPDAFTADLQNFLLAVASPADLLYSIVASQGYAGESNYVPGWSTLLDPDLCPTQFLPYLAQFNGTVVPPGTDDKTARQIIKLEAAMQRGTLLAIQTAALRYLVGTTSLIGTLMQLDSTTTTLPTDQNITSIPVKPVTQVVLPQTITLTDPGGTHSQTFLVMSQANVGDTSLSIYPETPNYAYPAGSSVQGAFLFLRERWNGTSSVADPYHLTIGYRADEVTDANALKAAVNAIKPAGIIVDYLETNGYSWSEALHTWSADTFTWQDAATTQP